MIDPFPSRHLHREKQGQPHTRWRSRIGLVSCRAFLLHHCWSFQFRRATTRRWLRRRQRWWSNRKLKSIVEIGKKKQRSFTRVVLQQFDEINAAAGTTRNTDDEVEREENTDEDLSMLTKDRKDITECRDDRFTSTELQRDRSFDRGVGREKYRGIETQR